MSILYYIYTIHIFFACSCVADFFLGLFTRYFLQTIERQRGRERRKKLYDIVVNTACIRYIIYGFSVLFCFVQNGKHAEKRLHTHSTYEQQEKKKITVSQNIFARNVCVRVYSMAKRYRRRQNGRVERKGHGESRSKQNTFAIYIQHSIAHSATHTCEHMKILW